MTEALNLSQSIVGRVVSNKMDKTVVVILERKVPHPKYGKFIVKFTKFYAHDENNVAKEGDIVRIEFTRPLSKLKRWKVVEVVESREAV